jgi:hypothetical protein
VYRVSTAKDPYTHEPLKKMKVEGVRGRYNLLPTLTGTGSSSGDGGRLGDGGSYEGGEETGAGYGSSPYGGGYGSGSSSAYGGGTGSFSGGGRGLGRGGSFSSGGGYRSQMRGGSGYGSGGSGGYERRGGAKGYGRDGTRKGGGKKGYGKKGKKGYGKGGVRKGGFGGGSGRRTRSGLGEDGDDSARKKGSGKGGQGSRYTTPNDEDGGSKRSSPNDGGASGNRGYDSGTETEIEMNPNAGIDCSRIYAPQSKYGAKVPLLSPDSYAKLISPVEYDIFQLGTQSSTSLKNAGFLKKTHFQNEATEGKSSSSTPKSPNGPPSPSKSNSNSNTSPPEKKTLPKISKAKSAVVDFCVHERTGAVLYELNVQDEYSSANLASLTKKKDATSSSDSSSTIPSIYRVFIFSCFEMTVVNVGDVDGAPALPTTVTSSFVIPGLTDGGSSSGGSGPGGARGSISSLSSGGGGGILSGGGAGTSKEAVLKDSCLSNTIFEDESIAVRPKLKIQIPKERPKFHDVLKPGGLSAAEKEKKRKESGGPSGGGGGGGGISTATTANLNTVSCRVHPKICLHKNLLWVVTGECIYAYSLKTGQQLHCEIHGLKVPILSVKVVDCQYPNAVLAVATPSALRMFWVPTV